MDGWSKELVSARGGGGKEGDEGKGRGEVFFFFFFLPGWAVWCMFDLAVSLLFFFFFFSA